MGKLLCDICDKELVYGEISTVEIFRHKKNLGNKPDAYFGDCYEWPLCEECIDKIILYMQEKKGEGK
jgi:hypothetical protein